MLSIKWVATRIFGDNSNYIYILTQFKCAESSQTSIMNMLWSVSRWALSAWSPEVGSTTANISGVKSGWKFKILYIWTQYNYAETNDAKIL